MNTDFGFGYDFSLIQDRFKNIHSKHYWPLCPQCKKFIPYFNLWKNDDEIFIDIKCIYCKEIKKENYFQMKTVKLSQYLDIIADENKNKEYNSILKEKINDKINSIKNQNKFAFCMDYHGWLDLNHYQVHEKMKFKTKHVICEKEIFLHSYCKKCKNKVAKFFCENCEEQLCKNCSNEHNINKGCYSKIKSLANFQDSLTQKYNNYSKFIQYKNIIKKNEKLEKKIINNFLCVLDFFLLYNQVYLITADQHFPNYWIAMTFLNLIFNNEEEIKQTNNLLINESCSINYEFRDILIKEKNSQITQILPNGNSFFISTLNEKGLKSSMYYGRYEKDLFETSSILITNVLSIIIVDDVLITLSSNYKNIYYIKEKVSSKNFKNELNDSKLLSNFVNNKFFEASELKILIYEYIQSIEAPFKFLYQINFDNISGSLLGDINYIKYSSSPEKILSTNKQNSIPNIPPIKKNSFGESIDFIISSIKLIEDPYLQKERNEVYISLLFIGFENGYVKTFKKNKDENLSYYNIIDFQTHKISYFLELKNHIIIGANSSSKYNLFVYKKENLINDNDDSLQLDKFESFFSEEGIINMQSINNMVFITGSKKGLISLWNVYTNSLLYKFKNDDIQDNLTALCVLNPYKYIISGYSKGQIVIWSVADYEDLPLLN